MFYFVCFCNISLYVAKFPNSCFVFVFRCSWNLFPQRLSLTWRLQCWSLFHMSPKTISVRVSSITPNRAVLLSATTASTARPLVIWRLAAETTGSLQRLSSWRLPCHLGQKGATANHTPPSVHPATTFQKHCPHPIMVRCRLHSWAVLALLIASLHPLLLTPPAEGR